MTRREAEPGRAAPVAALAARFALESRKHRLDHLGGGVAFTTGPGETFTGRTLR